MIQALKDLKFWRFAAAALLLFGGILSTVDGIIPVSLNLDFVSFAIILFALIIGYKSVEQKDRTFLMQVRSIDTRLLRLWLALDVNYVQFVAYTLVGYSLLEQGGRMQIGQLGINPLVIQGIGYLFLILAWRLLFKTRGPGEFTSIMVPFMLYTVVVAYQIITQGGLAVSAFIHILLAVYAVTLSINQYVIRQVWQMLGRVVEGTGNDTGRSG